VLWAWYTEYLPLYTISLSNCPASGQSSLAAWPIPTSNYYSQTHGFVNISQNAHWYYGSEWLLFPGEKGICPNSPASRETMEHTPHPTQMQQIYKYCWKLKSDTNDAPLTKDIFGLIDDLADIKPAPNMMSAYETFIKIPAMANGAFISGWGLPFCGLLVWILCYFCR